MNIDDIASPQNERFKNALKLHSSRARNRQNRILVIGLREVERAIEAGQSFDELFVDEKITLENSVLPSLCEKAGRKNPRIRIARLQESLFSNLAYGDRQAVVIGSLPRPHTGLDKIDSLQIAKRSPSLILVLESLEKPGNLGAIARSADATATDAILVADSLTDIYHPNAIRASVATVFSVPVACATTAQIQSWLGQNHYRIFVATPEASQTIFDIDFKDRVAVVIGNEAKGLSPQWRSSAIGEGVRLKMLGIGDSLNASVTASMFMYEALRQRSEK
jgi:RNA methyltransferase, TrmH family